MAAVKGLSNLGETLSGPLALFSFNPSNNLVTPVSVTVMLDILGIPVDIRRGMYSRFSFLKTDEN